MTRYAIDTDGVSRERLALAHDPDALRDCASLVVAATASAMSEVGSEGGVVRAAVERFRVVHVHGLDAVADAANALAGRLDRSTQEARSVELFVAASLSDVVASRFGQQGDSAVAGRR